MSVLIRGLEIPKNCSECPVALSGKYCRINQTYTTYIKLPIRPDHCPLVEVHGRLIDIDKLMKETLLNPCHAPYITQQDIDATKIICEVE